MTNPRYPIGCVDGSQVRGDMAAWSSEARVVVNFNNGNVNNNNRNNTALARAVRVSGEYQGAASITFHALYIAYKRASAGKKPSSNQMEFSCRWPDRLLQLERQITAGTWVPLPTSCFIATRPKAREIHAPDFSDRVVHHAVVPALEQVYEPVFIHDSYANRKGKGSHAAVARARQFVRQVHSGQGGGFYLQLDIHNFFNSIPRRILWKMLKARMGRCSIPMQIQQVVHALLRRSPIEQGVIHCSTPAQRAQVPAHKQLANAAPGCGIPIGNLSSQFFANVYLDTLDQFVKHELGVKRYLRYVDDFVLFHQDRAQLEQWQQQIEDFLRDTLQLRLKDDIRLRPLTDGLDFLGYVIYPTHVRVRRRVVTHARQAFADWGRAHVNRTHLHGTPEDFRHLWNVVASYQGHFQHANAHRLQRGLRRSFPWLASATFRRQFHHRLEGRVLRFPHKSGLPQ